MLILAEVFRQLDIFIRQVWLTSLKLSITITKTMFFSQKIYISNKPLILTNSAEGYLVEHPYACGYLLLRGAFKRNYRLAKNHLKTPLSTGVILEDIDLASLKQGLSSIFTSILAGGGIVESPNQKILMIYRRGKWDLPKGKWDEGESIEECALREVQEETGLSPDLSIVEKVGETYHVYPYLAKEALKTTHWFRMKVKKEEALIPQAEEAIMDAKWVAQKDLAYYLRHSWQAVKEIITEAGYPTEY